MSDPKNVLTGLLALWKDVRDSEPKRIIPTAPPLDVDPASATTKELIDARRRQQEHMLAQPFWCPVSRLYARSKRPQILVCSKPAAAHWIVDRCECTGGDWETTLGVENVRLLGDTTQLSPHLLEASLRQRGPILAALGVQSTVPLTVSAAFGTTAHSLTAFMILAAVEIGRWDHQIELTYGFPPNTYKADRLMLSAKEVSKYVGQQRLLADQMSGAQALFGGKGDPPGRFDILGSAPIPSLLTGEPISRLSPPFFPFLMETPWRSELACVMSLAELVVEVLERAVGESNKPPQLLLTKEAAFELKIDPRHVPRLVEAGRLERVGHGKITLPSLLAYKHSKEWTKMSASQKKKRTKRT